MNIISFLFLVLIGTETTLIEKVSAFNLPFVSNEVTGSAVKLGKKSTAQDVVRYLEKKSKLLPFIESNNDGGDSSSSSKTIAIVTGGNAGIGGVTVATLVKETNIKKIVLCTRNIDAGNEYVRLNIPAAQDRDRVVVQQLDLADMESIKNASEEIIELMTGNDLKLRILVNNAGVMALPQKQLTKQGIELQVGVNHVGHHMFTRLLLPYMTNEVDSNDDNEKAFESRIVTVSSTAHSMGKDPINNYIIDSDINNNSYSPWGAYGDSKLANILFTKTLQDKLIMKASNNNNKSYGKIKSVCLHPGVIGTNLWQNLPQIVQSASGIFADKTVEQGAATNVFCSISKDVIPGGYYSDCKISSPNGIVHNKKIRDELWDATENVIKQNGYTLPEF